MTDTVPASADLEQAFIGACLMCQSPSEWAPVRTLVDDECFTRTFYRAAWNRICESWDSGSIADIVTIAHKASADVGVAESDGLDKLTSAMSDGGCWSWTAVPRGKLLRQFATRRKLISIGTEAVQNAYNEDDIEGVIAYTARVNELLDELDARDETGDVDAIADEVERIADSGEASGWSVGIPHVDRWGGGIRPGECYVIGGPTGVGKTWCLGQMANALIDGGRSVSFVTLEMGKREIYIRLIAGRIGLIAFRLSGRGRQWDQHEYNAYKDARAALTSGTLRLYADQRSVSQIARVVQATEPDVVLIDYAQLLDWPKGAVSPYDAATKNMNELQKLAKRHGCAIILATQVSRSYLQKSSGPIQGGQDSGRIDQIADLWLMINRGDDSGRLILTCAKNRHGPTGEEAAYQLDPRTGKMVPAGG